VKRSWFRKAEESTKEEREERGREAMPAEMALTREEITRGEKVMDEEELFRYTSTLASKEFGGRFPGTDGGS